jgi:hypothetical protein
MHGNFTAHAHCFGRGFPAIGGARTGDKKEQRHIDADMDFKWLVLYLCS